ncbi:transmembrane transporter [Malassezia pachydermatis]
MASAKTSIGAIVTSLLVSGALQYTSTCLAMPFEVGKLLLQVQWVPREDVWLKLHEPQASERARKSSSLHDIDEDPWSDTPEKAITPWGSDDDEDHDRYFRDPSTPTSQGKTKSAPRTPVRRVDAYGYVVPDSRGDQSARPEFLMPIVVKGGVWEMIKAVARGKEGWMGLWKGALTTFLLDVSTSTLQPILSGILSIFAPTALNPMPIAFSPKPLTTLSLLMTSHLLTGILVSPLDLVRTRLIAQSTLRQHRKYTGPLDALRTIFREEGGWRTTYLHPNLIVPTILDFLFRPLFALGAPLVIENVFHLDPSAVPISYALAELGLSTLSLMITLPIETVRRRLQLQYHEPLRPDSMQGLLAVPNANTGRRGLRTCVETRPVPYSGVAEAVYRIVTEETTIVPVRRDDSDDSSTIAVSGQDRFGGIRGLYRGLGMGFTANLLVFVLTLLTGERQGSTGWTEI